MGKNESECDPRMLVQVLHVPRHVMVEVDIMATHHEAHHAVVVVGTTETTAPKLNLPIQMRHSSF